MPDLSKVVPWEKYISMQKDNMDELVSLYSEAKDFLEFYDWCSEIKESYVGMIYLGIIAIFLFEITPSHESIDEWLWVIVGDVPPAYLTLDECPNPATALDGYIGAMTEWVNAVNAGNSVKNVIPVNINATKKNSIFLKKRLDFLDEFILSNYVDDL